MTHDTDPSELAPTHYIPESEIPGPPSEPTLRISLAQIRDENELNAALGALAQQTAAATVFELERRILEPVRDMADTVISLVSRLEKIESDVAKIQAELTLLKGRRDRLGLGGIDGTG